MSLIQKFNPLTGNFDLIQDVLSTVNVNYTASAGTVDSNDTVREVIDKLGGNQVSLAAGNVSFPRRPNTWYCSAIGSFTPGATPLTKDIIRLTPFIVSETTSFDQMAMELSVAGSVGSVVRMGIYSSTLNYPSVNILNAGTIAGDSATLQLITLASTLTLAPGLYWLAFIHNSTTNITFRTIPLTSGVIPNILGMVPSTFNTSPYNLVQMSHVYDGLFPTISGSTVASLNVAIVAIKTI